MNACFCCFLTKKGQQYSTAALSPSTAAIGRWPAHLRCGSHDGAALAARRRTLGRPRASPHGPRRSRLDSHQSHVHHTHQRSRVRINQFLNLNYSHLLEFGIEF